MEDCLEDPLQLWPTCVSEWAARLFLLSVMHVCVCVVFVGAWDGVCLRRSLCGCGECEKLGVLTALEQFQYSAGAGGEPAWWIWGENKVSGGMDRRRRWSYTSKWLHNYILPFVRCQKTARLKKSLIFGVFTFTECTLSSARHSLLK